MAIFRILVLIPLLVWEIRRLRKVLNEVRPDIVHINNGGYPGALSCRAMALAARSIGVKRVLMVVNNLAVPYTRAARWIDIPIDHLVSKAVSVFVTGSSAAAQRLAEVLRLPPYKILPIHNGIRVRELLHTVEQTKSRLGLTAFDGLILGIVALHEPRKGHRILIDAVKQLSLTGFSMNKFRVLIEGDGPLRRELEALVADQGLCEIVKFVGVEAHVFDFMATVDALVLPSSWDEDFPNVILEAMSLGKPVIATRLAGIPEQVEDGVTGLLVSPGDASQLAQAIKQFVENKKLRLCMGKSGQERFWQNFACEVATDKYICLYQDLINIT